MAAGLLLLSLQALEVPDVIYEPLKALLEKLTEGRNTTEGVKEKMMTCEVMIRERAFRAWVAWVEDAKLRVWPMDGEDRARLRRVEDETSVWGETFAKWLEELDVQPSTSASGCMELLEWVLSEAVAAEYGDYKEDIEAMVHSDRRKRVRSQQQQQQQQQSQRGGGEKTSMAHTTKFTSSRGQDDAAAMALEDALEGIGSEAFANAVATVSREIFGGGDAGNESGAAVATAGTTTTEQLEALVRFVRTTTAVNGNASGTAGMPSSSRAATSNGAGSDAMDVDGEDENMNEAKRLLREFPVGLGGGGTGPENVKRELVDAVRVLRLLYAADLRSLQSQVDEFLVEGQAYTANPKTDSRLGKVGR